MKRINVWNTYDLEMQKKCLDFAEEYRQFLSANKTERECVDTFVNVAVRHGWKELNQVIADAAAGASESGKAAAAGAPAGAPFLKPGDKVYLAWMNKSLAMFEIGKRPLEEGLNILGAHIDSPRMDVKQNPLYEKDGLGYLNTHYYGGIKKYQFATRPLALHGVVVKKSGETVVLNIGEDPDDPVFFISDILIHLAKDQMQKKAAEVIPGELLDLIVGSKPVIITADTQADPGGNRAKEAGKNASYSTAAAGTAAGPAAGAPDAEAKDAVKRCLLALLKERYGIEEEDFQSAELEVVPAGPARDAGFDRSMILGYGQDDRVCAYPSFRAILDAADSGEIPERTSVCLLVDKEEIGSVGATGMQSHFFENGLAEIMNLCGQYRSDLSLRRCLANSDMLSSDVSAAFDPNWADRFDNANAAFLGEGLVFNKYTGAGGKSESNDANAEYIAHLRDIFDRGGVVTQTAELGRVDAGGGGTIAYILALYGMNVIDSGVPVLSMHSPAEAASKADIYEAYRGYRVFLKDACLRNV